MKEPLSIFQNGRYGRKALLLLCTVVMIPFLSGCAQQPIHWHVQKASITAQRQAGISSLENQGVKVIQLGETMRWVIPSDLLFQYNSANMIASDQNILNTAAQLLKTYSTVNVKIAAYTDNVVRSYGPANRKQALTMQQAQAVASYLWGKGIDTRLLYAVGYGQHDPVASNGTIKGRNINRRVEISFRFYLTPKAYG